MLRRVIFFGLLLMTSKSAMAQCDVPAISKLFAGEPSLWYGNAICAEGDFAAVGEPLSASGAVRVLHFDGVSWLLRQKLTPSDATELFGWDVCRYGDSLVVGAPNDDDGGSSSGAVYIFRYNGGQWGDEVKILPNDPQAHSRFGSSVAIFGDVVAVGAPFYEDRDPYVGGVVYVFRYDGSDWQFEDKLIPNNAALGDNFGYSLALDNGVLIAGAPIDEPCRIDLGAAFIFRHSGGTWQEEARLMASDGVLNNQFGWDVDIEEDRAAVGARGGFWTPMNGAAYTFEFQSAWVETQKLQASDSDISDFFGNCVDLQGDGLLVSNLGAQAPPSGSGYLFLRDSAGWSEKRILRDPRVQSTDGFGTSAVLRNEFVMIGAPFDSEAAFDAGAVYVFDALFNELVLTGSPSPVQAGDFLELKTTCGYPKSPCLLAVVDVQGVPTFTVVTTGFFDSDGEWLLGTIVPSGLSGLSITLRSFGGSFSGDIGDSNPAVIEFQ